jgi:AraC-like DNA-binding protein
MSIPVTPSRHPGSVGRSPVEALVSHLAQRGIARGAIAEAVGLQVDALDDPDGRFPFRQYEQLWRYAIERTDDPALGLTLGADPRAAEMGIVSHVVVNCETMREGLEEYARLHCVINDSVTVCLTEDDEQAQLGFVHASDHYCVPDVERTFLLALQRARAWLGRPLVPTAVHFEHRAPAYEPLYRRHFGCPVHFNAGDCRFVFPREYLGFRPERVDPCLRRAARSYAEHLLRETPGTLAGRIRALLYRELPHLEPSLETIAERLDMSRQTLYRRLKGEGAFFQKLVDGVRFDKARVLLRQSALSATDIALQLGFSELSAFSRAFKRWSGMSPRAFRDTHTIGP